MMQRNLSLDFLKVVLSFFVVGLHCSFLVDVNTDAYFATVHGIFRLAVPIFLIISGYYFFNITTKEALKSWIIRIGSLYLIWMLLYAPFWFKLDHPIYTLFTLLNGYYVLWYLSGTLISGLAVYFLRNKRTIALIATILSLYCIGFTIQTLGNFHFLPSKLDKLFNLNFFHRNAFFMCMPFFITGFLIRKHALEQKLKIGLFTLVIALAAVMIEGVLQSRFISNTEGLDQLLTLLIAAPIVFLYFKNITINGTSKELANFSTAIYLIHPFFILTINYLHLNLNSVLLTTVVLLLSIISALILLVINRRVKYLL
ncbi:acyltransferase family protein [Acinetobacter baumannii]|nr:acyltransferase family protein [Acinetobacter baumannii]